MTACPTCGHDPARKHATELEMQYPTFALALQTAADACGEEPKPIGEGCIGWRKMVWHQITVRKATVCVRSGKALKPGDRAWRQLSNTKGRAQRVAEGAWQ